MDRNKINKKQNKPDDGGKLDYSPNKGKGISFNTQGFTEAEVQRTSLCVELREKFNFECWVAPRSNKGRPTITRRRRVRALSVL